MRRLGRGLLVVLLSVASCDSPRPAAPCPRSLPRTLALRPDSIALLVLDSQRLAAIDDSQRLAWLKEFRDDPIAGEAVVARDSGVFLITRDHLYALSKNGDLRFRLPHRAWVPGKLAAERLALTVMTDSNAVVCDGEATCIKVSRGGDIAWRYALPANQQLAAPPVAGPNGSLYLNSGSWLHVVGSRGELRWKMPIAMITP